MDGASGDLAVCKLMAGAEFSNFAAGRLLVLSLDEMLAVETSVWVSVTDETVRRPWPAALGVLEAQDVRREIQENLEAIRGGRAHTFDLWPEPRGTCGRIQVTVTPRYSSRGAGGFFLVAECMRSQDADGAAARSARERLHALLRRAADAIVTIDEHGVIEDANLAAERLFDWPEGALVGRRIEALMPAPYSNLHQDWIESYLSTGQSGILNVGPRPLPAVTSTGASIAIELSISEAWIGGRRKFVGVCRDIGERLSRDQRMRELNAALTAKVEELTAARAELEIQSRKVAELARVADAARAVAEEADRAKSQMLVTVSHELRTPLNGVLAVIDLLACRELDPESRSLIEIVRRSGEDLVDLVGHLLDLGRVEAGSLSLRAEPFELADVVKDIAGVWRVAAKAKGLKFELRRPRTLPRVVGDAARLRQVLANLLSNAIKYTSTGAVALGVACRPAENGGAMRLKLSVSDTGGGLDAQARARLFERFARGGSEVTRREPGSGVGLAICQELVRLMGGTIQVEDVAGGTRFTVLLELPRAAEAASPRAEMAQSPQIERRVRALVAEDHPVNRTIIQLLLDQLGVEYAVVEDGLQALEAVANEAFDLVLMDVRMPGMDGLEASRRMRSSGFTAPIIAVTADAMEANDPDLVRAGLDGVLAKPITLATLSQTIATVLAGEAEAESQARGA